MNNIFPGKEKDILEKFYEKINSEVFYLDVEEIMLKFSEEVYYTYKVKIKGFMYRIMGYVGDKVYTPQEHLSIRFEEDDYYEIDFNNSIILCGKEKCPYYLKEEKKCRKYKQDIPNNKIICKSCFLEAYSTIINKFIGPIYERMERLTSFN